MFEEGQKFQKQKSIHFFLVCFLNLKKFLVLKMMINFDGTNLCFQESSFQFENLDEKHFMSVNFDIISLTKSLFKAFLFLNENDISIEKIIDLENIKFEVYFKRLY